jgi:3-phosphoshikimate 1-carboxyvinyltransferase
MGRLRYKESDRAGALLRELSRLGIAARIDADVMEIDGGELRGGGVQSHADHRIAMALAVLGLNAERPVVIEGASCVRMSYPGFFEDLASIGGELDE